MTVYDDFLNGGSASVLALKTYKYGQNLTATITLQNTSDVGSGAYTYGVGFSIQDASGKVWDMWNSYGANPPSLISASPGLGIATIQLAQNATGAVTMTVPIPNTMALGAIQIRAVVWKESVLPLITRLFDTNWMTQDTNGNTIEIKTYDIRANISSVVVS